MPLITEQDIRTTLGSHAFEAGRRYFSQGRVGKCDVKHIGDRTEIHAEVQGTQPTPYLQHIVLRQHYHGGPVEFAKYDCSCPVGWGCKHIAAALLYFHAQGDDGINSILSDWLSQLGNMAKRIGDYPPELRQRLFYLFSFDPSYHALLVQPVSVRLNKSDQPSGDVKPLASGGAQSRTPAKYLRDSDLWILPELARGSRYWSDSRYEVRSAALLDELLATGRAYWKSLSGPQLKPGPPLVARGRWAVQADGSQRFLFEVEDRPQALAVALHPLSYVDPATGEVGRLDCGLPEAIATALATAPPVPPLAAAIVAREIETATGALSSAVPLPQSPGTLEELRVPPKPVATLLMVRVRRPSPSKWGNFYLEPVPIDLPVLRLSFDYGPARFESGDPAPSMMLHEEGGAEDASRLLRIFRDPSAEAKLVKRLGKLGLTPLDKLPGLSAHGRAAKLLTFDAASEPADFVSFLIEDRKQLEAEGWTVEVAADFPLQLAEADAEPWELALAPVDDAGEQGTDWFDLSFGVRVDGQPVDILPALLAMVRSLPPDPEQAREAVRGLADDERFGSLLVPLPDGRTLPIPLARLAPILEALLEVWGPASEGTCVSRWRAAEMGLLHERLAGKAEWRGGERILTLARELGGWTKRTPTALPDWFAAALRSYQQAGLDWLQMLRRTGFGGVLADDMGLGKTVQTLAHLAVEKAVGRLGAPALVVAPTSVLPNWQAEAQRFAPGLRTMVLRGKERHAAMEQLAGHDLVITSYPLLARDREALTTQLWSIVVLDEAQTIRNPATAAAQAAFALKAEQRLALTGTPVENHLGDVWSLMHFLNPGMLGDLKSFRSQFRTPIEKRGDQAARATLARRCRPFLLRRTKGEVAAELPPKTEIEERVELSDAQAGLYEGIRLAMETRVRQALDTKGLARSTIVILDALLKLRQAACDPRLVKTTSGKATKPAPSAKLARLVELVEALREEQRRVLIFSQFTSMLELIRAECDARGWRYFWLTGDTEDRTTPVMRFQAGEVDLFLISLKAGGTGLNLTAADTVILYDPWWNPAVEAQAIDRAHRIGQDKPVFVHRLIASGTVEEKMLELQARKRDLAAALWEGDGAGFAGLTEEEVRNLFR